jgi:phage tail-like protein
VRGLVEGLGTPFPLLGTLPAVYHEDDFAGRMLSAFDEVLAPVVATLDNLDAYFDPALAPVDFVAWLADMLGFPLGETLPDERARRLLSRAIEIDRWRGTVRGLRLLLSVYLGMEPEIVDSGGCSWSAVSDTPLPGDPTLSLVVRLRPPKGVDVPVPMVEALIQSAKPVHVPHRLEIVTR